MQDLKPIRVFLEVAERRSFAAAAKALRMTPASVTRIVARLETDLGQQLLVRTTRQVSLTSAGALVAARYRPLVTAFDQASRDLARVQQPHRGHLTINAPLSFGMRLMPGVIETFRLAYPHITLSLHLTDRLVDVIEDHCDLAIRISAPPRDKSTIWRKICEIPRHAVAAPALFDRHPRPETPELLAPETGLSYSSDGTPEIWTFRRGATTRSVTAGRDVTSDSGDFLMSMVLAGAGIAVLPAFIHCTHRRAGRVEEVWPEWQSSPLWLSLYYPPYEALPPLVATFSDFFEAYLQEQEGFAFGG